MPDSGTAEHSKIEEESLELEQDFILEDELGQMELDLKIGEESLELEQDLFEGKYSNKSFKNEIEVEEYAENTEEKRKIQETESNTEDEKIHDYKKSWKSRVMLPRPRRAKSRKI